MMMHAWDGPTWAWIVMWGFMAAAWLGVIAAVVVALVRSAGPSRSPGDEPPIVILERRYARGELTHQEFEEYRRRLQHPS